jgi:hypothetical protein
VLDEVMYKCQLVLVVDRVAQFFYILSDFL